MNFRSGLRLGHPAEVDTGGMKESLRRLEEQKTQEGDSLSSEQSHVAAGVSSSMLRLFSVSISRQDYVLSC